MVIPKDNNFSKSFPPLPTEDVPLLQTSQWEERSQQGGPCHVQRQVQTTLVSFGCYLRGLASHMSLAPIKETSWPRSSRRRGALVHWKFVSRRSGRRKRSLNLRAVGTRRFLWPTWGGQRALSGMFGVILCMYACICVGMRYHLQSDMCIFTITIYKRTLWLKVHPREMIANAQEWAAARGLVRKNEVHKADEFRVPTSESYAFAETNSKSSQKAANFEMEDPDGTLLDMNTVSAQGTMMTFGSTSDLTPEHTCMIHMHVYT